VSVEPRELLVSYLPLIERAIAFASQRHGLTPLDAQDFASIVKLRLVENDYAIVRAFGGRSSPATYFGIVIQRMLFDYRDKEWGKWRTSAEARRLGSVAVELERHLYRDGLSLDEAFAALANHGDSLSHEAVEALAKRLPARGPKRRDVPIDEAEQTAVIGSEQIEADGIRHERREVSGRLSALVNEWFRKLPDADYVLLHQRFGEEMTVAQIARAMRKDQKQLYRSIERCLREVRGLIEDSGLASDEALDLIGRGDTILDFFLRKPASRLSKDCHGETTPTDPEGE
jgi:RNA polymerase sigma factor (sigma-70 family)